MTARSESTISGRNSSSGTGRTALSVFVAVCFFISGAAGLVYEILWVRLIDKVIGSAPFAVAAVLSIFMGGLAIGGYLAGRAADRRVSGSALLALYGKLEIGIGFCALIVPLLIQAGRPVYRALYDWLLADFRCYQMAAFAGCALVLIVPAALMGATLPVLCRYYVLRLDHIGTRTGRLYGLNTAGAAVGVILCGFLLIERLGVWMSLGVFAGLNVLVGLSCILLSHLAAPEEKQSHPAGKDQAFLMEKAADSVSRNRQRLWGMGIFAVSGFCAMAYEVIWTRLLGLVAGPTAYGFSLVLAAFIIGLALGSIFFGFLADKTRNAMLLLALTQAAAAVSALMVSHLLGNSQFVFAKLIHTFHGQFSHLILTQSAALFAILLIPTFFLGAAFPLVSRLCVQSVSGMGRTIGTAYALNTVGALIGSFIAGFVLIPRIGNENGLRLIILIQFTSAGLSMIHAEVGRKQIARFASAAALAAGFWALFHYPSWRTELLSRGWYRDFGAIEAELKRRSWTEAIWKGAELIARQRQGLEVVFQGEGVSGFTTVEKEITSMGTVEYALFNSGKADASSHGDRSTQTLSAHIPMLFHPRAQNVMVLGLASGMTSGEVLLYPIRKLDIVEISKQVADACRRFFRPWNNDCLNDPRTRLIVQDGRNHLTLTRESYDVIISEPSNPWMSGLANLFSLEFFRLARERLNPGGIFAQWIQSYEMDWETFCLLGRTFAAVFPGSALIRIGPVDYLLLGFKDSSGFEWSAAHRNIIYARQSKNAVFAEPDFLAYLILTEDLRELFGAGHLHTDNHPLLEFAAPRTLHSGTLKMDQAVADHRRLSPETRKVLDAGGNIQTLLDLVEFSASVNIPLFNVLPQQYLNAGQQTRYQAAVKDYCGRVPVPSYDIFSDPDVKACCAEIQVNAIRRKIAKDNSRSIDHYNLGLALIAARQKPEALQSLRRAVSLDPASEAAVLALGLLLAEMGELNEAAHFLSNAVALGPQKADPYKYLGMVELRRGAPDAAIASLSAAHRLAPDDSVILNELGVAFLRKGDKQTAIAHFTEAVENNPGDKQSRYYLERLRSNPDGDSARSRSHPVTK